MFNGSITKFGCEKRLRAVATGDINISGSFIIIPCNIESVHVNCRSSTRTSL